MATVIGSLAGLLMGALCLGAFCLSSDELAGALRERLSTVAGLLGWRTSLVPLALGLLGGYLASGVYSPWLEADLDLLAVLAIVSTTALLTSLAMVDLFERRLPDELNLALLVLGVAWHLATQASITDCFLGVLVGGGLTLLLAILGPVGMGDVKLVAALGALLGFPYVLYGFALGIFFGGLAAAILLVSGRMGRKDYMAYGPYLAAGGWIFWLLMIL